jgi:transcriptional regulator with XRE-family HTH domain
MLAQASSAIKRWTVTARYGRVVRMNAAKQCTLGEVIGRNVTRLREAQGWTREELAREVRASVGLPWTRSSVAHVEAGTHGVSAGELIGLAFALEAPLHELVAGPKTTWVGIAGGLLVRGRALQGVFDGTSPEELLAADVTDPRSREAGAMIATSLETMRAVRDVAKKYWPSLTTEGQLREALQSIDDTERKAAKRLGVDPHVVAIVAFALWGRSLAAERDARVSEQAPRPGAARSTQAVRGHVTRILLKDIAQTIEQRSNRGSR